MSRKEKKENKGIKIKSHSYPEINIEVACTAKFPVPHLERYGHFIILVEVLVEALEAMGWQDNVVSDSSLEGYSAGEKR